MLPKISLIRNILYLYSMSIWDHPFEEFCFRVSYIPSHIAYKEFNNLTANPEITHEYRAMFNLCATLPGTAAYLNR